MNPVTAVVQAGRDLISGGSPDLGLAYAAVIGMAGVLAVWAIRGVRRAETAGG